MNLVKYGSDGYKTPDGRFEVAKNYTNSSKWYTKLGWIVFDQSEIVGYPKTLSSAKLYIARRIAQTNP